jgi:copper chaperone CopZ
MGRFDYLHVVRGRVRVKVPEVKRCRVKAREVEQTLRKMQGVTHVKANPLTGNVLILFQPRLVDLSQILSALRSIDCFNQPPTPPIVNEGVYRFLFQSVAEVALERAILALL